MRTVRDRACAGPKNARRPHNPGAGPERRAPRLAGKNPADAQRVVIDGPAGIRANELAELLEHADALIIPVLPSRIDLEATEASCAKSPKSRA